MNILVIAHQLPYPPDTGGKIRLYHLYSRLAQRHSVTWVSPVVAADEPHVKDVLQFCEQVIPLPGDGAIELPQHGWRNLVMRAVAHLHWERLFVFCFGYVHTPGLAWRYGTPERVAVVREAVDSCPWDVIICETVNSVELKPPAQRVPCVVSLWDIQWQLFRRLRRISPGTWEDRLFYLPELLKIRRYEREQYRGFDAAVTVSDRDKASLGRLCPQLRIEVIDNGVDNTYYQPSFVSEQSNTLLFVGTLGYAPNRDAVVYFADEILPIIKASVPDTTFNVVGLGAPAGFGEPPGVNMIGAVPDVRPYVQQSSVIVVPLRAGSGTRIKIVEALAAGKPVVTTSIGAEGLRVEHGRHVLIADKPDDFAAAVVRLLRDPALRLELGINGRRLVQQEYDWGMLAQRFESVLADTVRRHKQTVAATPSGRNSCGE
jgi:glycosyltransferase involved in cell wall biosynthesis